jgi:hypothetical protein
MDIREVGQRRTRVLTAGLAAVSVLGVAGFGVLARADTVRKSAGTSSSQQSGGDDTSGSSQPSEGSDDSGLFDGSEGSGSGGTTLGGTTNQAPHAHTSGS